MIPHSLHLHDKSKTSFVCSNSSTPSKSLTDFEIAPFRPIPYGSRWILENLTEVIVCGDTFVPFWNLVLKSFCALYWIRFRGCRRFDDVFHRNGEIISISINIWTFTVIFFFNRQLLLVCKTWWTVF